MKWLRETRGVPFELTRHFLARMFDGESSGGQWQSAAVGLFALLLPAGMLLVREGSLDPEYSARYRMLAALPAPGPFLAAAMADQLALLTLVFAMTGLIALFVWQSLFPSSRDYLALAGYPIRPRQIFAARFTSVLLFAIGLVAALNLLPSWIAPIESAGRWQKNPSYLVNVGAQAAACIAGCLFLFFAIVALQGVLLNLLPRRLFTRASVLAQGGLTGAFLMAGLYSFRIQNWPRETIDQLPRLAWAPPVWFAGLHEMLLGDRDPFFQAMAARALAATVAMMLLAVFTYLMSYRRYRSLLIENSAAVTPPRKRQRSVLRLLTRDPAAEAAIEFMAKTLARSRPHRVIWLAYIGGAVAIMLNSSLIDGAIFLRHSRRWDKALEFVVLFWPLACSFILLNGVRHVCSLPCELAANWLFQITESQGRRQRMRAVERFVIAYAIAPIYLLIVPVAARVLGWKLASQMTLMQVLISLTMFEALFYSWQQFPFTCSYRPGKRPLVIVLSIYLVMLGVIVPVLTVMIAAGTRFLPLYLLCLATFAATWVAARQLRREGWGEARILYEDTFEAVPSLGIKELTYGGQAQLRRPSAGDAGHADTEDAGEGSDARLRSRGIHPADFRRSAEGGRGGALPGAAPAGTARAAGFGVGRFGEQPPRQILPADGGGQEEPGRGEGALEPHVSSHRPHHGTRLSEGLLGEAGTALWLRLRALFRRSRLDRDLDDELAFHLAMREEQRLQEGAAPRDAELAARRQFGNLTALRESCRDLWTFAWLETFVQDLRYGIRQLRRSPGFASVAAITLGVGIGATTAIFSMFDTVMWRSVNLPHPEQFVAVLGTNAANPHFPGAISPAELEEIGRSQSTVAGLAFWTFATSTIVDAGGEPVREESARVSANFFEVVGVQPSMGRAFLPESDREVILSDRLWRGRFAGDPGIIGRAIRVNGRNFTVVAVMPSGFQFPRSWRELWMPLNLTPQERQSRAPLMEAAGRLKPGRTIQQAAAELNAIGRRLEQEHPETNHDRRLAAWPLQRYLFGDYLPVYTAMVLGAAFFVLLIACGNVASLQFARATERWREIAVRAAIGAGRRRLIRQLVTESLVLAVAGAVVGLAGARWGLALVKAGVPAEMRRYMTTWDQIGLNSRAFAFALAAAVASAFLSGLAPAWRSTRANLAGGLKPDGRHKRRLTSALVAGEVALAFVLLMGAGLMVRGFRAMVSGRSDLRPSTLLTLRLTLSESQYRENHQVAGFYRELLARIRSLPGVQSATMVTAMPYSRHATVLPLTVEGAPAGRGPRESAQVQAVDPSYFNTMFLPVRGGRLLNDADGATSPLVTVISERAAKRWWPGAETPVSRRLRLGDSAWITIVGVTGDIPHSVLDREPRPTIYVPFAQSPGRDMNIGIRVAGDPLQLAPAVTAAVRALDPELPVENMATLETLVHQEAFVFAYLAALMGAFGGLALILAVVGVYGVTAHMVAGQTHEIGIRIALGASEGKVLRMLFRRGMTAAVVGMAIGLLPAYGLTRLMAFAMWGVGPAGQAGIQAIPLALAAATAAAIYVPARRALKIDPVAALRE